MNRKLFLKLGLLLISISFIACGQKNNSAANNNSFKAPTKQVINSTNDSKKEYVKTTEPKSEQQNNAVEKDTTQDNQQKTQSEVSEENQEDTSQNGVFNVAGGTNKVQGICDYYLNGIYVTPRIEPFDNSGNYSHYDIENEDNIYIDIILHVENLSDEAKIAKDIITGKVNIKGNEYTCFSVPESADGSDLESDALIQPSEIRNIHYVAEVPRIDATGEIEITLTINGKNYSNKFQLEG